MVFRVPFVDFCGARGGIWDWISPSPNKDWAGGLPKTHTWAFLSQVMDGLYTFILESPMNKLNKWMMTGGVSLFLGHLQYTSEIIEIISRVLDKWNSTTTLLGFTWGWTMMVDPHPHHQHQPRATEGRPSCVAMVDVPGVPRQNLLIIFASPISLFFRPCSFSSLRACSSFSFQKLFRGFGEVVSVRLGKCCHPWIDKPLISNIS